MDILGQAGPEARAKFAALLQETEGKVHALVNANNKGFCRALLDQDSLDFFCEFLGEVDTVNRCYLWRILFDHVIMLKLSPLDFITAV